MWDCMMTIVHCENMSIPGMFCDGRHESWCLALALYNGKCVGERNSKVRAAEISTLGGWVPVYNLWAFWLLLLYRLALYNSSDDLILVISRLKVVLQSPRLPLNSPQEQDTEE